MRAALLVLLPAFIAFPALSDDGESNLYTRSLVAYVQAKQEQSASRPEIVVIENVLGGNLASLRYLPLKFGTVRVEVLSAASLKAKFKGTGEQFDAVEIKPLIHFRDELVVNFAEFRVSVKKGRVNLGVIGGIGFHWRFDEVTGDYAVARIEPWRPQM